MKCQVLFSLKNTEKVFKSVVCCNRDWRLKLRGNQDTQLVFASIFPSTLV